MVVRPLVILARRLWALRLCHPRIVFTIAGRNRKISSSYFRNYGWSLKLIQKIDLILCCNLCRYFVTNTLTELNIVINYIVLTLKILHVTIFYYLKNISFQWALYVILRDKHCTVIIWYVIYLQMLKFILKV